MHFRESDIILEELLHFHDVDIQWGNHDISWMGAATGNRACICNVLRMALGYNGFDVLKDGYGINLRPLSMFAERVYRDDPCTCFLPQILDKNIYDAVDPKLAAKMHKAIAVLQYVKDRKRQDHFFAAIRSTGWKIGYFCQRFVMTAARSRSMEKSIRCAT